MKKSHDVILCLGPTPTKNKPFRGQFFLNAIDVLSNQLVQEDGCKPNIECITDTKVTVKFCKNNKFIRLPVLPGLRLELVRICQYLIFYLFSLYIINRFKSINLVYAHFYWPYGVVASIILKFASNAKSTIILGESAIPNNFVKTKLFNKVLSRFDSIILNSTESYFNIKEYLSRENDEKVHIISNGYHFEADQKHIPKQSLKIKRDRPLLSFVGSFSQRKGFEQVLQLCKKRLDWDFAFVGDGALVEFPSNVAHMGPLSHPAVIQLLKQTDIFILPSQREGMSNALVEAIACGAIPVVTKINSNVDLLGEDYSYYCDANDVKDIEFKVMQALCSSPPTIKAPISLGERITKIRATINY